MTNGVFFISHPFRIGSEPQICGWVPNGSVTVLTYRSGICVEIAPFESAVNPEILRSRAVTCQTFLSATRMNMNSRGRQPTEDVAKRKGVGAD
jgi:hypothetical protein